MVCLLFTYLCGVVHVVLDVFKRIFYYPKDHWTLKTGNFEDLIPGIQVQTLPLEGPRSLGYLQFREGICFFTRNPGKFKKNIQTI